MELQIPPEVDAVRQALTRSGYEAYAVGGCVRDSLLGLAPHDWDLTTSARPEQARRALSAFKVIDTGLKHGTVTALSGKTAVEVTSYRVDGPYSDGRHPDRVAFTASLKEDLARRDFTVNALAYSPETGVVDCFGGMKDLAEKRIRCVGDADRRFREDGLRILRAMRFSADLGFSIERETA
ncbi:MAG TPA: tRNA nucleotidyltransferase, partial [Ruminococcaceae bacterium]|nr:tRNA nucleotidyltransferase [Oscillospiraceae bacterium]